MLYELLAKRRGGRRPRWTPPPFYSTTRQLAHYNRGDEASARPPLSSCCAIAGRAGARQRTQCFTLRAGRTRKSHSLEAP